MDSSVSEFGIVWKSYHKSALETEPKKELIIVHGPEQFLVIFLSRISRPLAQVLCKELLDLLHILTTREFGTTVACTLNS